MSTLLIDVSECYYGELAMQCKGFWKVLASEFGIDPCHIINKKNIDAIDFRYAEMLIETLARNGVLFGDVEGKINIWKKKPQSPDNLMISMIKLNNLTEEQNHKIPRLQSYINTSLDDFLTQIITGSHTALITPVIVFLARLRGYDCSEQYIDLKVVTEICKDFYLSPFVTVTLQRIPTLKMFFGLFYIPFDQLISTYKYIIQETSKERVFGISNFDAFKEFLEIYKHEFAQFLFLNNLIDNSYVEMIKNVPYTSYHVFTYLKNRNLDLLPFFHQYPNQSFMSPVPMPNDFALKAAPILGYRDEAFVDYTITSNESLMKPTYNRASPVSIDAPLFEWLNSLNLASVTVVHKILQDNEYETARQLRGVSQSFLFQMGIKGRSAGIIAAAANQW
ncbi:Hypothetical protein HVR_LOCUS61 [uncultured virus]|nr:Hypothetical protein HVR_LOCUS61 [uncultured virus]